MKLFLFILFGFFSMQAHAQQVKSIIGSRTYFYETDSFPPTVIDTNLWLQYNPKGQLTREHDVEGVCYQDYVYDKKSRLVSENNYCGEGFSECTTEYSKKGIITTCNTNYHSSKTRSTVNSKGWILSTEYWQKNHENTDLSPESVSQSSSHFTYDAMGNETSREDRDEKNQPYFRIKRTFDAKGHLLLMTTDDGKGKTGDSVIYRYNAAGQLTEAVSHGTKTGEGEYSRVCTLKIGYYNGTVSDSIRRFNDTIIDEFSPYYQHLFEEEHSFMPSEISYRVSVFGDDPFFEEDKSFFYSYDDKGRLISVKGRGTGVGESKIYADASILYSGNEALLENHGENYTGNRIVTSVSLYKNGWLQQFTEHTENGFPYAVNYYYYEFYK